MLRTATILLAASVGASIPAAASAGGVTGSDQAGSDWDRVGPWNLFDGTDPTKSSGMGESGTLASAASPKARNKHLSVRCSDHNTLYVVCNYVCDVRRRPLESEGGNAG